MARLRRPCFGTCTCVASLLGGSAWLQVGINVPIPVPLPFFSFTGGPCTPCHLALLALPTLPPGNPGRALAFVSLQQLVQTNKDRAWNALQPTTPSTAAGWKTSFDGDLNMYGRQGVQFFTKTKASEHIFCRTSLAALITHSRVSVTLLRTLAGIRCTAVCLPASCFTWGQYI